MPKKKKYGKDDDVPWWLEGSLKDFGIIRNKPGGYDPPYVDLDGWKLGPYAPKHRELGQNGKHRPKPMTKPGEEVNSTKERIKLYLRPYNWHSTRDWVAKQFKGLREQERNYATSLHHYNKSKGLTMSNIAKKQQRRRKVAQLLLEGGYSQRQMADILDVSATTINRDVQVLDKIWREEMAQSVDTYRARLLRRLGYVMRESKEAWERSKLKKIKKKTKESKGGKNKGKEITISKEDLIGDPRHLENFKDAAVDTALFQGVEKQDSTKFEVTIMPPLPEEKFGRYGITSEDYDKDDDSNELENVKIRMENKEKELLKQEQMRIQARRKDAEEIEFEEIEDDEE